MIRKLSDLDGLEGQYCIINCIGCKAGISCY